MRATAASEDPVAVQVLIGAATGLISEFAQATGKPILSDVGKIAKPEYAKGLIELVRSRYNYFKHSNFDHDKEIDVTNLTTQNDLQLFLGIVEYENVFSIALSQQMKVYLAFVAAVHPDLTAGELRKQLEKQRAFTTRSEALTVLKLFVETDSESVNEIALDKLPLIQPFTTGYYDGPRLEIP